MRLRIFQAWFAQDMGRDLKFPTYHKYPSTSKINENLERNGTPQGFKIHIF